MKPSVAINLGLQVARQHHDKTAMEGAWFKLTSRGNLTACVGGLMWLGLMNSTQVGRVRASLVDNPFSQDPEQTHLADRIIEEVHNDKDMVTAEMKMLVHPVTKKEGCFGYILTTLNDDHQWTANKIIKWLKKEGM